MQRDDDDDDLSLLRACEAHLVRLETQRRDLSEDSPFLHRVMMGLGDDDDPSKSSSSSSVVVEAMRRDTEKGGPMDRCRCTGPSAAPFYVVDPEE